MLVAEQNGSNVTEHLFVSAMLLLSEKNCSRQPLQRNKDGRPFQDAKAASGKASRTTPFGSESWNTESNQCRVC